ncbi:O-linked N-acetylglucosamine transferase [Oscillatoria acuminata]|uniref:protein O-GlcNAc transferase n=1 Tax=Oscillatoria acuminata PCC 6304 TaxID=56110 RepID=K9TAY2_9CYAN|nr:O-linked N-acetylglucosamine transferase [Oscillatoria acuminata]AFY80052.1 putative O-linked N-acetylglucosamine transferase, SPINDLY family [Oscillatoria acuminata PCC 6304]
MTNQSNTNNPNTPEEAAYQFWRQGDYQKAADQFEEAISINPMQVSHYWHLGLMLLLQKKEAEAQMVWALVMSENEPDKVETPRSQLIDILESEASRQESLGEMPQAWLIREYIKGLDPDNLDNLLQIIPLSIGLNNLEEEEDILWQVITLIKNPTDFQSEGHKLLEVLQDILNYHPTHPGVIEFVETLLECGLDSSVIYQIIFQKTADFINQQSLPTQDIINYAELCRRLEPNHHLMLASLAGLYQKVGNYSESLKMAENLVYIAQTLEDQLKGYYLIITSLLKMGGAWKQVSEVAQKYQELLIHLIETGIPIEPNFFLDLMGTLSFHPYLTDVPENTHQFRNQFADFYQNRVKKYFNQEEELWRMQQVPGELERRSKVLKIGYLSSCFYRHSVGWLSRWLFKYHDSKRFEVYGYSLRRNDDNLQANIAYLTNFRDLSGVNSPFEIAELIGRDHLDILVDLDSLTHRFISPILALKPAPIQVTWLGSDASGLPGVDYFIADPYVLPDSAQDYYRAKIVRLPEIYVAVDGFEVGVPTLRRDELGIPDDAVVYFSGQTGYKRNPQNVRLQLQIIQAVPNSYFLIKSSIADQESVKRFFEQMAEEEGVKRDRLRFLPPVASEEIHRANLAIADVVLDTYPYNGATTTLETLWMGIPLVTRVGEQFAARNSYTMMMNVGVSEGIAWTDEDYVAWGIRLGTDTKLREEISWRLRQSQQTSPLWNAEKFTREMEISYQKMWDNYLQNNNR